MLLIFVNSKFFLFIFLELSNSSLIKIKKIIINFNFNIILYYDKKKTTSYSNFIIILKTLSLKKKFE